MQTEEQVLPVTSLEAKIPECSGEEYELVYHRPATMVGVNMHYCPGCAHSLVHKLIMETVEELDIQDKTIGIAPVGCSVFAYDYMDIDMQEAAHGTEASDRFPEPRRTPRDRGYERLEETLKNLGAEVERVKV